MLKTESLPDEAVKTDDPIIIDEIAPNGGSPYAKRHAKPKHTLNVPTTTSDNNSDTSLCDGWTSKEIIGDIYSDSHMSDTNSKSVLTLYDYDYSSTQGSPYTRRYPAQNREIQ